MVMPPSTTIVAPVMKADWSDARKQTALARILSLPWPTASALV